MKQLLLTILITLVTHIGSSQDSITNEKNLTTLEYVFTTPNINSVYEVIPYNNINLHLNKNMTYNDFNPKSGFFCLFIAGLAFTTAAILEGTVNYGTWQPIPGSPGRSTYVVQNFWSQTPRQIMLCVGIGFTLVGGVGTISK